MVTSVNDAQSNRLRATGRSSEAGTREGGEDSTGFFERPDFRFGAGAWVGFALAPFRLLVVAGTSMAAWSPLTASNLAAMYARTQAAADSR
jgi:hypothetical protein